MTIYTEADIKVAARNWVAFDHLLADPASWPRLLGAFDRDLFLERLVYEAHGALLPLTALATRRFHALPLGQCDAAPPLLAAGPRGPRFGRRSVWEALGDPRAWFVRVLDACGADAGTRFAVVSQVCVRGAWDFADRLAVERAARYALSDWVGPLLRLSHATVEEARAGLTRQLTAPDPLDRLDARARLAALDDDWRDLFAHPSVLEYRRLYTLPPDLPPPWARH